RGARRTERRDQRRPEQRDGPALEKLHDRSLPGTTDRPAAEPTSSAAGLFFGALPAPPSGEEAAQRLLARPSLDQRTERPGRRRDERDVTLADRGLLGQQPRAQQRLAHLERERALVARESPREMAELGVVAAVLAHAVETPQHAA